MMACWAGTTCMVAILIHMPDSTSKQDGTCPNLSHTYTLVPSSLLPLPAVSNKPIGDFICPYISLYNYERLSYTSIDLIHWKLKLNPPYVPIFVVTYSKLNPSTPIWGILSSFWCAKQAWRSFNKLFQTLNISYYTLLQWMNEMCVHIQDNNRNPCLLGPLP